MKQIRHFRCHRSITLSVSRVWQPANLPHALDRLLLEAKRDILHPVPVMPVGRRLALIFNSPSFGVEEQLADERHVTTTHTTAVNVFRIMIFSASFR